MTWFRGNAKGVIQKFYFHPLSMPAFWAVLLCLGTGFSGQAREGRGGVEVESTSTEENPLALSRTPQAVLGLVRNPSVIRRFEVNSVLARQMTHRVVQLATGASSTEAAWRSLVLPGQRIGIKVSTQGGPFFSSHPAVVGAVVDGLVSAGITRERIIVFDKSSEGLRQAGLTRERLGCRVMGFDPPNGWDREGYFRFPFSGRLIWGDLLFAPASGMDARYQFESDNVSDRSHFSKIFNQDIDKVISIPVISSSSQHGIHGTLINSSVSQVDNNRRFGGHPLYGESSIAALYAESAISAKTIFHLADGLVIQYSGGPQFAPKHTVQAGLLLASKDPVAVDRLILEEIEKLRKDKGLPPLAAIAKHISAAGRAGLGEAVFEKIRVNSVKR